MRKSGRRHRKAPSKKIVSRSTPLHRTQPEFWKFDHTGDLDLLLMEQKPVQDLLGFSRETVGALFEHAIGFLQVNRPEDAVLAFSFLTKLNPYVADFWLGYGLAYFNLEEYVKSQSAFLMALALDPSRFDIYSYAIDCCIEMKEYAQADALLEEAVGYAKRHPRNEESLLIMQEASKLKEKIDSYKT